MLPRMMVIPKPFAKKASEILAKHAIGRIWVFEDPQRFAVVFECDSRMWNAIVADLGKLSNLIETNTAVTITDAVALRAVLCCRDSTPTR